MLFFDLFKPRESGTMNATKQVKPVARYKDGVVEPDFAVGMGNRSDRADWPAMLMEPVSYYNICYSC